MVKSLLKAQTGFSLIEVVVAMGLTVAASAAYMTHMQTVAKNEMQTKVKSALMLVENQANDYLKSRDVCNDNMFKAFTGKTLNTSVVQGNLTHKRIQNKAFLDTTGATVQKDIFLVDQSFENGSIWVQDVKYSLNDVQTVVTPNSPWNKSAALKIEVVFEKCAAGGPVYRLTSSGVKVPVCPNIITQSKTFERFSAFKTDAAGNIAMKRAKVFDPATQKWILNPDPTVMVPQAACADSQDALVDAANSYTDLKVCIQELKGMIFSRKSGTSECGVTITSSPRFEYTYVANAAIVLPKYIYSEEDSLTLIGGGSRGTFGGKDGHGKGGKASILKKGSLESLGKHLPSSVCTIGVGQGGREGFSENGQASFFKCGLPELRSLGGIKPNGHGGSSNIGEPGENSMDGAIILGAGGSGRCASSCSGSDGVLGAGGGGGAQGKNISSWRKQATSGGNGFVKLKYMAFTIADPDDVFGTMGTTAHEFLKTAPGVIVTGP